MVDVDDSVFVTVCSEDGRDTVVVEQVRLQHRANTSIV